MVTFDVSQLPMLAGPVREVHSANMVLIVVTLLRSGMSVAVTLRLEHCKKAFCILRHSAVPHWATSIIRGSLKMTTDARFSGFIWSVIVGLLGGMKIWKPDGVELVTVPLPLLPSGAVQKYLTTLFGDGKVVMLTDDIIV